MIINTNVASLSSQNYLSQTNKSLQGSLEKLSSGLRINSASDDASGLAISEKLRAQISGLQRASMNAQDGISMLQTAEGALQETTSILQRMRELAVQASNGTYTSNDRQEIQKEVDQLKDEINRISTSTEFNTKKLLNGDASALWSSNTDKISTVVNGETVEGNYSIEINDINPGQNEVYKTDVMSVDGMAALSTAYSTTTGPVAGINNVDGLKETGTGVSTAYSIDVTSRTSTASETASIVGAYSTDTTNSNIDDIKTGQLTLSSVDASGYLEVEVMKSFSGTAASSTNEVRVRYYDAAAGTVGDWQDIDVGTTGSATVNLTGSVNTDINFGSSGAEYFAGDKMVLSFSNLDENDGTGIRTNGLTGNDGAEVVFTSNLTGTTQSVYMTDINTASGDVSFGSFDVTFADSITTGSVTFYTQSGGIANDATKLEDIARFTTADGRSVFSTEQELNIYGNGEKATIYLNGSNTINELEEKLTDAIVNQLGMGGGLLANSDTQKANDINDNLVNFVGFGDSEDNTNEAVEGTFVTQSALLGDDSKLSFVGDQGLIDGLSLATIQEGKNSSYDVEVFDAHSGRLVGEDVVNNYSLQNVIEGVDVNLDSSLGIQVEWKDDDKEMDFTDDSDNVGDLNLHLVDNATQLQIGANEGQSINVSIGQIDTTSLGIDDAMLVDQDLASEAITKIDKAIQDVSGTRATIGAQINRLDHAINNLNIAEENLTASESRIRDLDVASEMAKFTKNQILSQAGTSMLAQANQLPQQALQLLGG